jgi:hypothetical protein
MPRPAPSCASALVKPWMPDFGGGVIDLAVLAGLAVDRADIDDAAEAARAHAVDHRPRHVETGREVGLDHGIPLLEAHPVHRRVTRDAGIVDQHVDRAEIGLDLLDPVGTGGEVATSNL